jgi:peptidyl-prolyl cis-trans isomerase SurA
MRFSLFPTLLSAIAVLMSQATSAELLDRSIAIVNHQVITETELIGETRDVVRELSAKGVQLPPPSELYKQVLEHLILKQAQEDLANQLGIRIRDEEVNERLALIAEQNKLSLSGLRDKMEQQEPESFIRLREAMRKELTLDELRNQEVVARIRVTPEEVKNFVNRKLGIQGESVRYHVQHLLIALPDAPSPAQIAAVRERADGIWKNLKEGADFAQLAIRYSADSKALEGGDLGWMDANELPTFLEESVTTLTDNGLSDPIQSPLGFHIIKLLGKEKSQVSTLPADVEQQAFRILRTQKGNNLYEQWLRRVRDEAYVTLLAPEFARD